MNKRLLRTRNYLKVCLHLSAVIEAASKEEVYEGMIDKAIQDVTTAYAFSLLQIKSL